MDRFCAQYLELMGEPPLSSEPGAAFECYRLLRVPSFLPQTMVRIQLTGTGTATAKALGGSRAAGPKVVFDESRAIASAEAQKLRSIVQAVGFWWMGPGGHQGLDGESWILEGRRDQEYREVYRWSPDVKDDLGFMKLCNYMLEIAPQIVIPPPTPQEIAEWERRRVAEDQARGEQDELREARRARSNEIAQRLQAQLKAGRPLTCPHCRQSTSAMRFVDKRPDSESYFVCDRCKRSSVGLEIESPAR